MRTTVDLPEGMLRALKSRAALKRKTLAAEVCDLIEAGLRRPSRPESPVTRRRSDPPLIRATPGVVIPSLSSAQLARIEEEEDLVRIARSTR